MGPPLFLTLLFYTIILAFTLVSNLCQGYVVPLHAGWRFSADLSLSSPLPQNAFSFPAVTIFSPILSSMSFSSGKGFSLGFYSVFNAPSASEPIIFLTVCLGTNKTDSQGRTFTVPVWHLERRRELKQVKKSGLVSLSVNSSSKDLVLRDGDGSFVWKVGNVEAMELQDDGNWILYDAKNRVIWQSFDHPSDALLKGQRLQLGQKLISNNSHYVAQMAAGGLAFYMNAMTPAPLVYWAVPLNVSLVSYVYQHLFELSSHPLVNITASMESFSCPSSAGVPSTPAYTIFDGTNLTVRGDCSSSGWAAFENILGNSTFMSDFFVLSDDGYPRGYSYLHLQGENYLFSSQGYNISYSCMIPNACGAYGICSEYLLGTQHTCQCPSSVDNTGFENAFDPIDPFEPSQGCHRRVPLTCSSNAGNDHSLVEIKKSTFISIHLFFETTYKKNTLPLHECIDHCMHNCSCSGFFYHYGTSYCMPFSDTVPGLSNITFISTDSLEFSTYVKLQNVAMENSHLTSAAMGRGHFSSQWSKLVIIVVAATTFALILPLFALLVFQYRHLKQLRHMKGDDAEVDDEDFKELMPLLPTRYTYEEMYKITDGFDVKKMVGSGGFGCVYLGIFGDGRKIAVKKLDMGAPCLKQFLAEVATIGAVSHFNIARLCGFCSQKSHRLLVYEFMENGSLDQWLFSVSKDRLLSWATRYQIALGTAHGLVYLHEGCPTPIIHFDVKPQNILLDTGFIAKLSDFGLCKLVGRMESSCVMTGIRGTPGYLAPEWLSHSIVGKKCDVYSFGMVLLELVAGRKNTVQALVGSDEWYFPMWAAMLWKQGRLRELVDARLCGEFDEEQVRRIVHVGFLCIQREPSLRPSMGCVYQMIEGSLPLGKEDPPFDLAMEPLSPMEYPSLAHSSSCTASSLLVGR